MNEPLTDKTPKPPGLLPKHVQSWLLLGLALAMVVIMWLTGGKKLSTGPKSNESRPPASEPTAVSETKIAELQNRIQELQREQLVAQNALAQQSRLLRSTPQDFGARHPGYTNEASGEHSEDPIEAERKRRNYLSLFASNVALSFRKKPGNGAVPYEPNAPGGTSPAPDAKQLPLGLTDLLPLPPSSLSTASSLAALSSQTQASSAEAHIERKEESNPAAASGGARNAAAGKTYILFEGTIFETVLINRLEGQFSGPLECLVTTDTYSHDRQHLLIPAGTHVLGETLRVENAGQTRLAVAFHRLIMPDGYSVGLDQFKGLDQIGDAGLRDQVNNHYLRIFGASLAIGALGAVAEAGTGGSVVSGGGLMRQGFAASTAQSSAQILDRFLNILPNVSIREGRRVKVYLSGDLSLPDYNNHQMPSDL